MQAVALYAFCLLNSAYTCRVALFPAILTLGNIQVHICISNCSDKSSNIKSFVNEGFSFGTTLSIPNINPNYYYVWLGRHLDDPGFWGQNNIIENIIVLKNLFNIIWYDTYISGFRQIRNTDNFQIWFRLRQFWKLNLVSFNT